MTPAERDKKRDETWEKFKETHAPKGQAQFYYVDNAEYFKAGFDSAVQLEQGEIEYLQRQLADERSGDCDIQKTNARLQRNIAALAKDHADDWKRIQDAERERDRWREWAEKLAEALDEAKDGNGIIEDALAKFNAWKDGMK